MITIDISAQKKLFQLAQQHSKHDFYLCLNGGGCSGFTYSFDFYKDQETDPEDLILQYRDEDNDNTITVRVDFFSVPMLSGTTVVWEENGFSSKFNFVNPNTSAGCGCGKSVAF